MDLIKHTTEWALGDAFQGKLMLVVGLASLVALFFILRGENQVLRGMLIPLGLIALVGLGYGGFLSFSRPGHIEKVAELHQENPEKAIALELKKAQTDNRNYSMAKTAWPVLIAVVAILLYFLKSEYTQGVLIGLLMLFVYVMLLDTFLHQRLRPYLNFLLENS